MVHLEFMTDSDGIELGEILCVDLLFDPMLRFKTRILSIPPPPRHDILVCKKNGTIIIALFVNLTY